MLSRSIEQPRVSAIGSIIDHHHRHGSASPALEPIVVRTIHLHQLSKAGLAFSPLPVLLASPLQTPTALGH
jgi:hypothetical protein